MQRRLLLCAVPCCAMLCRAVDRMRSTGCVCIDSAVAGGVLTTAVLVGVSLMWPDAVRSGAAGLLRVCVCVLERHSSHPGCWVGKCTKCTCDVSGARLCVDVSQMHCMVCARRRRVPVVYSFHPVNYTPNDEWVWVSLRNGGGGVCGCECAEMLCWDKLRMSLQGGVSGVCVCARVRVCLVGARMSKHAHTQRVCLWLVSVRCGPAAGQGLVCACVFTGQAAAHAWSSASSNCKGEPEASSSSLPSAVRLCCASSPVFRPCGEQLVT